VLGDLPRDTQHLCWTSQKYILATLKEVNELAFLFGVQADPDLNSFGRVFGLDLHGLGVLGCFESSGRGGMAGPRDADGTQRLSSLNVAMAVDEVDVVTSLMLSMSFDP
jgi:hypothetical protein